jgi:hypothetical protein
MPAMIACLREAAAAYSAPGQIVGLPGDRLLLVMPAFVRTGRGGEAGHCLAGNAANGLPTVRRQSWRSRVGTPIASWTARASALPPRRVRVGFSILVARRQRASGRDWHRRARSVHGGRSLHSAANHESQRLGPQARACCCDSERDPLAGPHSRRVDGGAIGRKRRCVGGYRHLRDQQQNSGVARTLAEARRVRRPGR